MAFLDNTGLGTLWERIKAYVASRKHGGTNILRGTNTAAGIGAGTWETGTWRGWAISFGGEAIEVTDAPNPDIKRGWKFDHINISKFGIAQTGVPLAVGVTYTMSCYARGTADDGGVNNITMIANGNPAVGTFEVTDAWQRYSYTFTAGEKHTSGAIIFGQDPTAYEGIVEICGMKLEVGDAATDWSPSPWDIDAAIAAAEAAGGSGTAYATCGTAAATAAKEAAIVSGTPEIVTGARVTVKFTYANTAASPTLSIDGGDAVPIYWHGAALNYTQYWQAGAVLDFVYNGTQWELVGVAKDNNDHTTNQYISTANETRPLLLSAATDLTSNSTYQGQAYRSNNMYANPSTGTVTTKYHELTEEPTADNQAITKGYGDNNYLPKAGGTVSGDLTVAGALYAHTSEEGAAPAGSSFNVADKLAELITEIEKYLPLTGGTITGDLRLKDSTAYGRTLYWGDGSYVYIKEPVDDIMELHSKSFRFTGQGTASANPLAVNQGGSGAVTADAARANFGAAAKWDVLWTNSSRSSTFAAQTITINNLSNYNLFVIGITWSNGYTTDNTGTIFYVPETTEQVLHPAMVWYQTYIGAVYRKTKINRSENTVYFETGTRVTHNGVTDGTQYAIPLHILGTAI